MAIKVTTQEKPARSYVWGTVFFIAAVFIALSLLSYDPRDIPFNTTAPNIPVANYTGLVGASIGFVLFFVFGLSAIVLPVLMLLLSLKAFQTRIHPEKHMISITAMLLILSSFLGMREFSFLHAVDAKLNIIGAGGMFGYRISNEILVKFIGEKGSLIVLLPLFILALAMFFDFHFSDLLRWGKQCVVWSLNFGNLIRKKTVVEKRKIEMERELSARPPQPPREIKVLDGMQKKLDVSVPRQAKSGPEKKNIVFNIPEKFMKEFKPKTAAGKKDQTKPKDDFMPSVSASNDSDEEYRLPPLDLLDTPPAMNTDGLKDDLEKNSLILEGTLKDFGIDANVVEVQRGPVITTYEVQPAPGVKVNRITALADDIALSMKAASIRIVAPIPGKSVVGIEVPNSKGVSVFLKELLVSDEFKDSRAKLALLLGKDVSGSTIIADLAEMPHLLIAGTTGSGKTVCMNTIILSILYTMTPEEAKLLLVDPKKVELLPYKNLPHLVCPVVTDPKRASSALQWAVKEMEKRYMLFAHVGVRNIAGYNTRPDKDVLKVNEEGEAIPKTIPYIVVIIDELNDLMMVSPVDIENAITRLAQLSRAVGIHMILATQRPSVNVITGVIKANFPARIAFQVASKVDSRTILDANGADKLLGKGDMLFLPPGSAKLIRAQGAYVADKEINRVIEFIQNQRQAEFDDRVNFDQKKGAGNAGEDLGDDELYDEAVEIVLQTQQASASVLQRKLRVGYARAARLIDMMEEQGVVGPHKGSRGRDILIKSAVAPRDGGYDEEGEAGEVTGAQ
jgi:S-DNA-T family DNA segregation ATPase FtsK/SpoIIIE